MLVVEASVAVESFLIEPGRPEARRLLDGGDVLVAPERIVAEVVDIVWKRLVAKAIDRSQAADVELRHPAYDCFYLALAEARNVRLVTADRRMATKLVDSGWQDRCLTLWN